MENKRYIGLDVFRILCYLVVCAFHTTYHLGCSYGIFSEFSQMGAIFMTAFFMMSGYVLFLNYRKEDLKDIKNIGNFILKRLIGIIPMYYISAIVFTALRGEETAIQNLLLAPIEALGLQSAFSSLFSYSHNGGTWFISCILICYLIYPYIQEIIKQLTVKRKIIILLVIIGILMYSPIIVYKFNTKSIYSNPIFRGFEFCVGIILASMTEDIIQKKLLKKIFGNWLTIIFEFALLIIGVTVGVKMKFHVGDYMYYNMIAIPLFICMLVSFTGVNTKFIDNSKVIKYFSGMAYSFFLAQLFSNWICLGIINKYTIKNNIEKIALGWGVCIVIAFVIHEIIEKRLTKFLRSKIIKVENE